MFVSPNIPTYSTPIVTMASVINRLDPAFSVAYCEYLLSHMSTESFHFLGNLPLTHLAALVRNRGTPPSWVPQSFVAEMRRLADSYRVGC